jgi:adenosylmethionine-8-amino-7-oxononanoate aminotransferase
MLCSKNIYNRLGKGSGFFQHGHTYMGHPVACAAGLAVLKAILNRKILSSIKSKSNQLFNCLETELGHHPNIGDIRGRGLFIGIEIVQNIETKKPFDPNLKVAASIKHAAFEAGLICYPMSGTRDGKWGDHILLAPPFIINENQIIELVNKLSISIENLK